MSVNRASIKTQKAIERAYLELMKKKPYTKITVREITEAADINRSTFYNHYQDIYDLINKIEDRIIHEVCDKVDKINREKYVPGKHPQHVAVFEVLLKYEKECRLLLGPTGDVNFIYKLQSGMREAALRGTWFHSDPKNSENVNMFIAYISAGIIGLYLYHLDDHAELTADKLGWIAGEITNTIDETYVRGQPNG